MGSGGEFDIDPNMRGTGEFHIGGSGKFQVCAECCEQIEPGTPCVWCGDGVTPLKFTVRWTTGQSNCIVITDLMLNPTNQDFKLNEGNTYEVCLEQDEIDPCFWRATAEVSYTEFVSTDNPCCSGEVFDADRMLTTLFELTKSDGQLLLQIYIVDTVGGWDWVPHILFRATIAAGACEASYADVANDIEELTNECVPELGLTSGGDAATGGTADIEPGCEVLP